MKLPPPPMPALLNSRLMWSVSCCARTSSRKRSTCASSDTSHDVGRDRESPGGASFAARGAVSASVVGVHVARRDGASLGRQLHDELAPHARAAAGDDRDLAVERVHDIPLLSRPLTLSTEAQRRSARNGKRGAGVGDDGRVDIGATSTVSHAVRPRPVLAERTDDGAVAARSRGLRPSPTRLTPTTYAWFSMARATQQRPPVVAARRRPVRGHHVAVGVARERPELVGEAQVVADEERSAGRRRRRR